MFPDTPRTLLKKIVELANGDDASVWNDFVEMYTPVLRAFIRGQMSSASDSDVEDAVQDVFVKMVPVLREGRIEREKGRLRSYLVSVAKNILIDRYRENQCRPRPAEGSAIVDDLPSDSLVGVDPGVAFDAQYRLTVHEVALEHILANPLLLEGHKAIYRAMLGGLSPKEAASRFGVSHASAKQIKSRLDRAVQAQERRFS